MKPELHVHQSPLDGRWCWEVVNSGRRGLLTVAKSPTSAYATAAGARRGFHRFRKELYLRGDVIEGKS